MTIGPKLQFRLAQPFAGQTNGRPLSEVIVIDNCPDAPYLIKGGGYMRQRGSRRRYMPVGYAVCVGKQWLFDQYPHLAARAIVFGEAFELDWRDELKPCWKTGSSFEPESEHLYAD